MKNTGVTVTMGDGYDEKNEAVIFEQSKRSSSHTMLANGNPLVSKHVGLFSKVDSYFLVNFMIVLSL